MKERIRKEIKNRIPQDEKWNRFYRDMEKLIYPPSIVFVEIYSGRMH